MRRSAAVLPLVALVVVGCASSPARPVAQPAPQVVQTSAPAVSETRIDAVEYRKALEEAYAQIVARSSGTTKAPVVDADAALSMPIPDHRSIRGAIDYFSTDLHDQIQRSLYRSATYRTMIEGVLDEYRLPRGLAYLPVIESAYLPTLTSSAGAHGVWQFMPGTARDMGLSIDWWIDERANPEKATRAAAKYLRYLYNEFGDWPLALAAYNAGPGRIRRAMEDSGSDTFWELVEKGAIPRETRGYVPTFYATLVIVSDPAAYGFELREPEAPSTATVEIEGPVSLQYLGAVGSVDKAVLRDLNAHYKRGVVPPGRHVVRVPHGAAEPIAARATTMKFEDPELEIANFTLRNGDSLAKLARALKKSEQDLLSMNGLRRNNLEAGDSIYLPVRQSDLSSILRKAQQPPSRYHKVKKGETLYSIARAHGLSVEELLDLNRMTREKTIHPGDKLRVSGGPLAVTAGGGS